MKRLFYVLLACLALFAACDSSSDSSSRSSTPSVIFGVMSDTHIGASALASSTPEARLQKAYQKFASIHSSMDAIITVGDFTEGGTLAQFNAYKAIMDEHSKAKNNLLLLGNHDNMNVNGQSAIDRFVDVFGCQPTKETVINGYHFITVSTGDSVYNTTSYHLHKTWLEERLAAANAKNPHKPIFVFIHHTMAGTDLIGSHQAEAVGAGDLYDVFKQYPQVVTFSGHSHVSFSDPRNIWQGDYTALNCGSVYYTALDTTHHLTAGGIDNAADAGEAFAPFNRGESSTALIVEVKGTKVTVRRIDNYWNIEIPTKFVFDTSKPKSKFPYLESKRIEASAPPQFAAGSAITLDKIMDNGIEYTFPQAMTNNSRIPDEGAFAYEVSIKEQPSGAAADTARLQALYFMFPRPTSVSYDTKKLQPDTSYEISVTPVGYFGKKGSALTLSFKTAEEGAGDTRDVHPIPIAALLAGVGVPALPPGTTMDAFVTMITGYPLFMVNGLFGETIFFKDNALDEPFEGTDVIDITTIIYSIISLQELMSYL